MKKKWIVLTGIIIAVVVICKVGIRIFPDIDEPIIQPLENDQVVEFPNLNMRLHFKACSWGISGNHSAIILSTTPIVNVTTKSEKNKRVVFSNIRELYYKKKGLDSLLIYVGYKTDIPDNALSKVKINQIQFKNRDNWLDFKKNYKKYGLEKISIYQE